MNVNTINNENTIYVHSQRAANAAKFIDAKSPALDRKTFLAVLCNTSHLRQPSSFEEYL